MIHQTGFIKLNDVVSQGGSSPNELRNLGAKEAKDLYTKLGRLPVQVSQTSQFIVCIAKQYDFIDSVTH